MEGEILRGKFSIIYISSELLLKKAKSREMLRSDLFQQRMVGFIVDEAHCIKKWYVNFIIIHLGSITIRLSIIVLCRGDKFRVEFSHLREGGAESVTTKRKDHGINCNSYYNTTL